MFVRDIVSRTALPSCLCLFEAEDRIPLRGRQGNLLMWRAVMPNITRYDLASSNIESFHRDAYFTLGNYR